MKRLNELTPLDKANLFSKLRISLTHHSSAIEGVSLSFGETKNLLERGMTAHNKSLYEQLVVIGFAEAYDYITREASNSNSTLSPLMIKDIHSILFSKSLEVAPDRTERPVGAWRLDERHIKEVDTTLTSPKQIAQELDNLLFQFNGDLSLNDMAKFHIKFEQIHPFADGNGRVGRLIMAYQAIQNNYIPPLILNENRLEYLNSFKDVNVMESFLAKSINEAFKMIGVEQNQSNDNSHGIGMGFFL